MDAVHSHVALAGTDACRAERNRLLDKGTHARGVSGVAEVKAAPCFWVEEFEVGCAEVTGADVMACGARTHAYDGPAGLPRHVSLASGCDLHVEVRPLSGTFENAFELRLDRQPPIAGDAVLCLLYA